MKNLCTRNIKFNIKNRYDNISNKKIKVNFQNKSDIKVSLVDHLWTSVIVQYLYGIAHPMIHLYSCACFYFTKVILYYKKLVLNVGIKALSNTKFIDI